MEFIDGSKYVGGWAHGMQNGQGKIVKKDGSVEEGSFKGNIFYGNRSPPGSSLSHSQQD